MHSAWAEEEWGYSLESLWGMWMMLIKGHLPPGGHNIIDEVGDPYGIHCCCSVPGTRFHMTHKTCQRHSASKSRVFKDLRCDILACHFVISRSSCYHIWSSSYNQEAQKIQHMLDFPKAGDSRNSNMIFNCTLTIALQQLHCNNGTATIALHIPLC